MKCKHGLFVYRLNLKAKFWSLSCNLKFVFCSWCLKFGAKVRVKGSRFFEVEVYSCCLKITFEFQMTGAKISSWCSDLKVKILSLKEKFRLEVENFVLVL